MRSSLSPLAQQDLVSLEEYLEERFGQRVADRFYEDVWKAMSAVAAMPYIGQGLTQRQDTTRKLLVGGKTWMLYRIRKGEIRILRFFDARTNPENCRLD